MQTIKALLLPAILIAIGAVFSTSAAAANIVSLASPTYSVNENAGSVSIVVQLDRSAGDNKQVTVNFATRNGSASEGSDYFKASGTLTFQPNQTMKLVSVSIINDSIPESSETFTFNLSNPSPGTTISPGAGSATITINDDDGSPDAINMIEFSAAEYGSVETNGPGEPPASIVFFVNAIRRGDPNRTLMAQIQVSDATAKNGTDYTAPTPNPKTIMFPPGTDQVKVIVPLTAYNPEPQDDRYFTATLSSMDDFTAVGPQATARAMIFDNSGPNTVELLSPTLTVREGSEASFTIPVFRTGAYSRSGTTVNYTTEIRPGDTAQAGVNFTQTSGTITFGTLGSPISDNEHMGIITIPIPDNSLAQGDVTFHVTLLSSDFAQLGPVNTTQVTIEDDDAGSVAKFSSANYTVSEDGGHVHDGQLHNTFAAIKVNLIPSGNPSQTSVVDFSATSITAFAGFDFSAINTTLVFQPGEFSKTVMVPIMDDFLTEPSETFRVTLSNPGVGTILGTPSSAIVTILDDDQANVVQFSPTDYSVAENAGTVNLTVFVNRANNPNDTITVHYMTVANTATKNQDYTNIPSGTLIFGPGETQKTIPVHIINDKLIEGAENFFVQLTDAASETPSGKESTTIIGLNDTASITILDDDSPDATIGFSQDSYNVGEGDGFATLTITRSGGLGVSAAVDYSTSDGTAKAGVNYRNTNGSVTFAPGQVSKTIKIPIIDDATANPTLSFTVTLTAADGSGFVGGRSQATVNIIDNDATTFDFNPSNYTVDEGSGTVTLTVEALRVGDPNETISVDYVTSDGTAKTGTNYTRTSGRLTFGPNVSSQTITVPIVDNSITQGTTSFTVSLSNPLGDGTGTAPKLGSPRIATVNIIDNDATTFQFGSDTYTANDNAGAAQIEVTLSRIGNPDSTYSVSYATRDLTAQAGRDYVATSGTLTFGPGVTSRTISVPLIKEPVGEPTRQFEIVLSHPTGGAMLGTQSSTVVNITNPDLSTKPVNISTRGLVQTGDGVMIAGFIIQGDKPKQVIVRGLGPSLTQLGVVGALQDPTLDLRDARGNQIAYDDDYKDSQEAQIEATMLAPGNDKESAIVATLAPGSYTAILRGKTNGVGEVDVYDLDTTSATHLANISTRAFVGPDNNTALIGGFQITGQTGQQVLIRAIAPSLAGVSGALADTTLDLYHGSELVLSNDNWKTDDESAIQATGLAPGDDKESAILATLDPGSYTAVVRGKNNTTGIALVEVYQMP